MDKFFSVFGKVVLVLVVVVGIAFGGFYLGKKGKTTTPPKESLQDFVTTKDSNRPTPTPKQTREIAGGVSKEGGLAFDQYTLQVPIEWTIERKIPAPASEQLIITKGDYEVRIFQAATGGALCLYAGDADFEGPSSRYTNYVDLTTQDTRLLRRSGTDTPGLGGKTGFTLCQRNPEGDYNQPTGYGHISFSLPSNYDQATLAEMDAMITSLKSL